MSLILHVCSELSNFKAMVVEGERVTMADMKEAIYWKIYKKCSESSAVDLIIFMGHSLSGPVLFPGCESKTSEVNTHFQQPT